MNAIALNPAARFISRCLIFAAIIVSAQTLAVAQPGVDGSPLHGEALVGYYPVTNVYRYAADINVWFDFGNYNKSRFFFNGGVLTLIKSNSDKGFQPDRYRGTVEAGVKLPRGQNTYALFVKHQSLHDIDRFDGLTESYEILGLRYYANNPWNLTVSAGNYIHKEDVDYGWDYALSVDDGCIGMCGKRKVYAAGELHYVTEDGSVPGRDNFLDYRAEIGLESSESVRYFLSYQNTHDIDRFAGRTEHGLVVGVRYAW